MNQFYIYTLSYKEKKKATTATVIFCPGDEIDLDELQDELKVYYTNCYQTDKTIVIGGAYIQKLAKMVVENKTKIFKYVPKIEPESFYTSLHVVTFDIHGQLSEQVHADLKTFTGLQAFGKVYHNEGMQQIFVNNGGLVESTGTHHHFVFPSGKHSDKFLRVANILLLSSEIYFIATSLLKYFDTEFHKRIYCDTSSINSVALALNDLLNRFKPYKAYPINSFKSYQGLYDSGLNIQPNSFIIISASTSGGMVDYILRQHGLMKKDNIVILYYLENRKPNNMALEQVACNLTQSENNVHGIPRFATPDAENCMLCNKDHSFPVLVSGDVFLLEQPRVNSVRINAGDMDVDISSKFINQFISSRGESSILKVNYKETGDDPAKKYDIYIDYSHIIDNLNGRLDKYKTKLDAYIDQYVPSNTKYILHLDDDSSEKLASYINDHVASNYQEGRTPTLLGRDRFDEIQKNSGGSILIVASCISNGKNLLYLSRALRDYNLRIVYFIGINRSPNAEAYAFLKTNLKYGAYGSENSSFVEVEKIHCSNSALDNPWQVEIEFLKENIAIIDNKKVLGFLKSRLAYLESSYSSEMKGLSKKIFLPIIQKNGRPKALKIRRNSAFFNNDTYADHVSQSDVYFNIAHVLNKLRNSNTGHTLKQSMFVRNVISPENLNRFNDGIIQSSILRNAKREELNFSIDETLSMQLRDILITIFKYCYQEQGEAILEFLHALAIKKLMLKKNHLSQLLEVLDEQANLLVRFYCNVIKDNMEKDSKNSPVIYSRSRR